ncbi:MAG TPA: hypothetical protein VFB58_12265 [Chloroflexota bacterium]|nr:hypothetical protein [Chloroflexota bacterium]
MIQTGGAALPRARSLVRLRDRIALLRTEVAVGSVDLARLGLIGLALALQTVVLQSPGHFRPAGTWYFAVLVAGGTFTALALSLAAALPRWAFPVPLRRTLGVIALASLIVLSVIGGWKATSGVGAMLQSAPPSNDGAVMDYYAARQFLRGHNPYIKTNLVLALASINAPATTTTPLMEGQFRGARTYPSPAAVQSVFYYTIIHSRPHFIPPEFESKYNYPAGSFLFILPLVWAGISDMRFLYALALVAMGLYMSRRMPRSLRPLTPLLILANVPLIVLTAGGQPDPLYGLFLMIGYAEWATPWISPTFIGIAAGTKQIAWFFVPFYLLLIWKEFGAREAIRRFGILCTVFAVMNAPFFVQSPRSYISSLAGPMSDPMFPLGIGVIALFVSHVLPTLPKVAFTVMEGTSWLAGTVAARYHRVLLGGGTAALAALPLFFAWRSLVNYFYLVPLLALAITLAEPAQRRSLLRRRGR